VRAKAKGEKDSGKRPTVIAIHENRGLNPHIEDVARRLAVEGYLALAPDLLSVNGGTPPEEDKARELHTKTEREDMIAAALAAIPFMAKHAESTGKVGAVGFCFGGGVVNRMPRAAPILSPRFRITACRSRPRWCRRSRRRSCCNTPRPTRTSTKASRPTRRR
jgi:dienelactone hydrolase